jgi:DNA mismatch repair protein MutL
VQGSVEREYAAKDGAAGQELHPQPFVPFQPVDAGGFAQPALDPQSGLRFYGYLFGFFLLVSDGECFYLIDQHAAHERILYEKFLASPIARQPLLVPIRFTTNAPEDDRFLSGAAAGLEKLGVIIKKAGDAWVVEELPALWRLSDAETVREVLSLREAGENIVERWAATIACHAAIKDGSQMDAASALNLAAQALKLPARYCPHGRPIMRIISKNELLKAVKRL